MEFTIDAVDGVTVVPYSSHAMNRMISFRPHSDVTAGTIEVKARPFGRSNYLTIDGVAAFTATSEISFTVSYPIADIEVTISGISGGNVIYLTIEDGV